MLASTALAGQTATPGSKTIGIGLDGKRLTDKEFADMTRVLPMGETPWLVNGAGPGAFGPGPLQYFRAYMPPISATQDVRRGVAFEVVRPSGRSEGWSIRTNDKGEPQSYQYAQVAMA